MESTALPAWRRYPAHAAHSSMPEGRGSGELTVTDQGFRFRAERNEFFIPLKAASLTLGGASDRIVFVAHAGEPGLTLYSSDLDLLRDPILAAHPELTGSLRSMRNRRTRNRSVLIAACLLIVSVPVGFVLNLDFFAGFAVRHVPYTWEEQLGRTALGQIQVQSQFMDNDAVGPLLAELTTPLVKALGETPYTFHFYVARDASINAFALPGGYIVIHSELLLRADSAEELLGVLAHEIAHVTERHGTRSVIAKAGAWLVFQAMIGDAGGVLATMAGAAPFLLSQSYSRSFENDADEEGFRLLAKARIDADGMASFFGKIRDEEIAMRKRAEQQIGDRADMPDIPEFLRTHPLTENRIEHIERLAENQQGPYLELERPFQELRNKVEAFTKHAPEDQVTRTLGAQQTEPARSESARTEPEQNHPTRTP